MRVVLEGSSETHPCLTPTLPSCVCVSLWIRFGSILSSFLRLGAFSWVFAQGRICCFIGPKPGIPGDGLGSGLWRDVPLHSLVWYGLVFPWFLGPFPWTFPWDPMGDGHGFDWTRIEGGSEPRDPVPNRFERGNLEGASGSRLPSPLSIPPDGRITRHHPRRGRVPSFGFPFRTDPSTLSNTLSNPKRPGSKPRQTPSPSLGRMRANVRIARRRSLSASKTEDDRGRT